MRPLFLVQTVEDFDMKAARSPVLPLAWTGVGRVVYNYAIGAVNNQAVPAVTFRAFDQNHYAPGAHEDAYMVVGSRAVGVWPAAKARLALIATPAGDQPIVAAIMNSHTGRALAYRKSGRPRDPGHYFLEVEAQLDGTPGQAIHAYVRGAGTVLSGAYLELSWQQ